MFNSEESIIGICEERDSGFRLPEAASDTLFSLYIYLLHESAHTQLPNDSGLMTSDGCSSHLEHTTFCLEAHPLCYISTNGWSRLSTATHSPVLNSYNWLHFFLLHPQLPGLELHQSRPRTNCSISFSLLRRARVTTSSSSHCRQENNWAPPSPWTPPNSPWHFQLINPPPSSPLLLHCGQENITKGREARNK